MTAARLVGYFVLINLLLCFSTFAARARQASSRELFKQYLSEFQRNPNDQALREKIIQLALELKPAPAVPEEAERHMARGVAAMKAAKDIKDFNEAAAEFEKAASAAPWLGDAYYNSGVAKDKAGDYAGALEALKFYLIASPEPRAAKEARSLIYEIESRQEKAARDAHLSALEQVKRKEQLIKGLTGRWIVDDQHSTTYYRLDVTGKDSFIVRRENTLYKPPYNVGTPVTPWDETYHVIVRGVEITGTYEERKNWPAPHRCGIVTSTSPLRGSIVYDGSAIEFEYARINPFLGSCASKEETRRVIRRQQ